MEPKDMRVALKEAGQPVPVKNADVVEAYNAAVDMGLIDEPVETSAEETEETPEVPEPEVKTKEKKSAGKVITYIGSGDTPPYMINFMGRQKFMRGKAVEVTDPVVLAKIKDNASFIEGELEDESVLFENDEEAAAHAKAMRDRDAEMQKEADKRNKE